MRPYLKYVGSKQQLYDRLAPKFPEFTRLVEPFCGSAAVFFNWFDKIDSDIFTDKPYRAVLCDANSLLINCHTQVAWNLSNLTLRLLEITQQYSSAPQETYKNLSASVQHLRLDTEEERVNSAAIYLAINKSSFNGLWRINKSGKHNSPHNGKEHINLVTQRLKHCSYLLQKYADIHYQNYTETIAACKNKDTFFFIDPPYVPLTATASFTDYTQDGWKDADTVNLKEVCDDLTNSGVKFMLTNSSAPRVYDLFKQYRIVEIEASRMIRASSERPSVMETVITNY